MISLLFFQKKREETAYEKEKVGQAKRIMEPFVMRRVKKDVSGAILFCMTDRQAEVLPNSLSEVCNYGVYKKTRVLRKGCSYEGIESFDYFFFQGSEQSTSKS